MQTMSRWTDDRMDDLSRKVDGISREMHAEFRALRGEMRTMQATMVGGFVSLLAALIVTQL